MIGEKRDDRCRRGPGRGAAIGGKWRRAATTTASDLKTLLATRNAIFAEVNEKAEAAGKRFGEICGSHQDYIWEILHEKP